MGHRAIQVLKEQLMTKKDKERLALLESQVKLLRKALDDLYALIVAEDLVPESVGYMRQAAKAIESTRHES